MSPQSILVTGGAGYIGSICVERLLAEGHTVTVLDNLSVGHRAAVASEAAFHQADIGNLAALRVVFKQAQPEAILHFAGSALVGESMEQPLKYFQNNTANALNLLHCAAEFGVGKFIFSSTCSTYGIPEIIPISETTPQRPVNPYGESKRMFEQMLKWHAEQTTHRSRNLPLLQRRWRHCKTRRASRARNPSHPAHPANRPWPTRILFHFRDRASHARRHLCSGLHSRERPRRSTLTRPAPRHHRRL